MRHTHTHNHTDRHLRKCNSEQMRLLNLYDLIYLDLLIDIKLLPAEGKHICPQQWHFNSVTQTYRHIQYSSTLRRNLEHIFKTEFANQMKTERSNMRFRFFFAFISLLRSNYPTVQQWLSYRMKNSIVFQRNYIKCYKLSISCKVMEQWHCRLNMKLQPAIRWFHLETCEQSHTSCFPTILLLS